MSELQMIDNKCPGCNDTCVNERQTNEAQEGG